MVDKEKIINVINRKRLFCIFLLGLSLPVSLWVNAGSRETMFLRGLNVDLWKSLELDRLEYTQHRLEQLPGYEWNSKLATILSRVSSDTEKKQSSEYSIPLPKFILSAKASMGHAQASLSRFADSVSAFSFKALGVRLMPVSFNPKEFPVLWLSFPEITEFLGVDGYEYDFYAELRDFQHVVFPCRIVWKNLTIDGLSFRSATLPGMKFDFCNFHNMDLTEALMTNCKFKECGVYGLKIDQPPNISELRIIGCPDKESQEAADRLFNICQSQEPDGYKKDRIAIKTVESHMSAAFDSADLSEMLDKINVSAESFTTYVRLLSNAGEYQEQRLLSIIHSADLKSFVAPDRYIESPEITLNNAQAIYILLHHPAVQGAYDDMLLYVWNMLVICPVGFTPYRREQLLVAGEVRTYLHNIGKDVEIPKMHQRQYQAALLDYMQKEKMKAVVIPKDDACFYNSLAYHFHPPASVEIPPKDQNWMRVLLAILFNQYRGKTTLGCNVDMPEMPEVKNTGLAALLHSLVSDGVNDHQVSAINDPLKQIFATDSAESIFRKMSGNTLWGESHFVSLAAILLQRPAYLITGGGTSFMVSAFDRSGECSEAAIVPVDKGKYPLLIIHSGYEHWLTAEVHEPESRGAYDELD